ncbi:MAG TPA: family 1 glycosylhydrolase [Acidimicrobiales bacterium]
MKWPDGFMWGTGASSNQCEGAAPASDWLLWEQAGKVPPTGEGNGFGTRFAEDFVLYAGLGLTHHRMSIEWARIEPEEGVNDPAAIAHYRDILKAARAAGVTPWVSLHHFTLPQWFANLGGFLVEENRTKYWGRHVAFMADTFGDLAGGWQPINETNYYASLSYLGGGFPPGHSDRGEWMLASEAIHLASAEGGQRLRQTGLPVSSIFGLSCEVMLDEDPATKEIANALRAQNWNAGIGLFRDGVLRIPGRDPIERPELVGCYDMLGFSFYGTYGVLAGKIVPYPPDAPRSPLGYGIWSGGLDLVLQRLVEELPNTPLLLAEFGIGTDDDEFRAQYLSEGLAVAHAALARGVDLRGFFHWTGVDNYEWKHGYDVSFGIISRDREVRPSAHVLAAEANQ